MRICLDLDGTICHSRQGNEDYSEVKPRPKAVEAIQKLKSGGHYIIIYTSRHMETCNSNVGLVVARQAKTLLNWLDKYKIPYDEMWFGKPLADVYIDDRAFRFTNWEKVLEDVDSKNLS